MASRRFALINQAIQDSQLSDNVPLKDASNTFTGPLRLTVTNDVSLSSTDHAFQIGPTSGLNISMDSNEIMARNNGAASALHLNFDGGNINVSGSTTIDFGNGLGEKLSLFADTYGIGIEDDTLWYKANFHHRFYIGEPDGGTSDIVEINTAGISTSGTNTNPGAFRSSLSTNMLHISGKEAIDGNDSFMRLNQNQDFTDGVYTPGNLRAGNQIRGKDGTAGSPSYSFAFDTDTGFWRSFSDAFSAAVGGVEVLRIGGTHIRLLNGSTLTIAEAASANSDAAGHGQIWVKNTVPCQLWFTRDDGTEVQLS